MTERVDQRGDSEIGTIDANGEAGEWVRIDGEFNFALEGNFVGTIVVDVSFDDGVSSLPLTNADGSVKTFTAEGRIIIKEPEEGVHYRPRSIAWTSGAANYRFSK